MPHTWEKEHYKLGQYDRRRCDLTEEDKEQIKYLYDSGMAVRAIARLYATKCSRRTIIFFLQPKKLKELQERNRINKHWKKYYDRKALTKATRDWRRYKSKLIKTKLLTKTT